MVGSVREPEARQYGFLRCDDPDASDLPPHAVSYFLRLTNVMPSGEARLAAGVSICAPGDSEKTELASEESGFLLTPPFIMVCN